MEGDFVNAPQSARMSMKICCFTVSLIHIKWVKFSKLSNTQESRLTCIISINHEDRHFISDLRNSW